MFTELPRYFGVPNQVYVEEKFAFNSFVANFNGKAPLMVSTYKFIDRKTPVIDNMVFDIDSYFGLRIPYSNTKALKQFCDNHKIPYLINFSGGKGFHFFIIIKDIIPKTDSQKQMVKDKMYSCQEALVKLCNVDAIDYPTMGRLHFLIRFPTSQYVRHEEGKLSKNGFYCRNISPEDFEQGLKYISKIIKEPGEIPVKPKATKSLDDIIRLLPNFKLRLRTNGKDNIQVVRAGMTPPSLMAIGVPCLKKIAENHHPSHHERIELVSFLKMMGYSDVAINGFIKNLKWKDYKYAVTSYQVSTIKGRYPNCKFLSRSYESLCNGCPLRK